jgi:hypothetical protein
LLVCRGYCRLLDVHLGDQRFGNVWAEYSNIGYVWFEYVRFYNRRFYYVHLLCMSAYVSTSSSQHTSAQAISGMCGSSACGSMTVGSTTCCERVGVFVCVGFEGAFARVHARYVCTKNISNIPALNYVVHFNTWNTRTLILLPLRV